jgi:uncharacterized protein (DUF4415 family)
MPDAIGRKPETDDESPEWTSADFTRAKAGAEAPPAEVLAAFGKRPGRPRSDAAKVAVKLRLDPDILAAFRATGDGWQTRINAALRTLMPLPKEGG